MTIDRSTPTSGPLSGSAFATAVNEEVGGLWDRAAVTLGGVAGTNTVTATATPTLLALAAGQAYWIVPANTNTGTVTLNIDSTGAKTLVDAYGNTLGAGEFMANVRHLLCYDGTNMVLIARRLAEYWKGLTSDDAGGTNVNTAQPWFPTAGGLTLPGTTAWWMEGLLRLSRAAGTTSHTTAILFGGTATITSLDWFGEANTGDANTLAATNGFWATSAAALVLKAASTSATEQSFFRVSGVLRVNAGGTFIPQFQYSVAPGGAPSVLRGSFFRLQQLGLNTLAAAGPWA